MEDGLGVEPSARVVFPVEPTNGVLDVALPLEVKPHESSLVGVAHDGCADRDGLLRPVVDGPMLADQLVFDEAGHEHRAGAFGFDAVDVAQECLAPGGLHRTVEVGAHPVPHVAGHADVDGRALLIQKPVDPRRGRQRLEIAGWDVLGQPGFTLPTFEHIRHHISGALRGHHAVEQFHRGRTVAHGPVPGVVVDAEVLADVPKAVAGVTGEELTRHAHRAEFGAAPDASNGLVVAADERIIEPYVVRHEDTAAQEFFQLIRNGFERRRCLDHVGGDARELRDVKWNGQSGVDEGFPPFEFRGAVGDDRGNLDDGVALGVGAGGFDVDDGVARHGAKFGVRNTNQARHSAAYVRCLCLCSRELPLQHAKSAVLGMVGDLGCRLW